MLASALVGRNSPSTEHHLTLIDLNIKRHAPAQPQAFHAAPSSSMCDDAPVASAAAQLTRRESWLVSTYYDGEMLPAGEAVQQDAATTLAGATAAAAMAAAANSNLSSPARARGSRLMGSVNSSDPVTLEVIAAVAVYLGGDSDPALAPQKTYSPGVYSPVSLPGATPAHAPLPDAAAALSGGGAGPGTSTQRSAKTKLVAGVFVALEGLPFLVSGQFYLLRGAGANGLHLLNPFLAPSGDTAPAYQQRANTPGGAAQARNPPLQGGPPPSLPARTVASVHGHMTIADVTHAPLHPLLPQQQQQQQGQGQAPSSSLNAFASQQRSAHNRRVLDGVTLAWMEAFKWACGVPGGGGPGREREMAVGPFVGHMDR